MEVGAQGPQGSQRSQQTGVVPYSSIAGLGGAASSSLQSRPSILKLEAGIYSVSNPKNFFSMDQLKSDLCKVTPTTPIEDAEVTKANSVATFLEEEGKELVGTKSDGNCLLYALIKELKRNPELKGTLKIDLEKSEEELVGPLRLRLNRNTNGEWLSEDDCRPILDEIGPYRYTQIEYDSEKQVFNINDMIKTKGELIAFDKEQHQDDYIHIIDLGHHFVTAKQGGGTAEASSSAPISTGLSGYLGSYRSADVPGGAGSSAGLFSAVATDKRLDTIYEDSSVVTHKSERPEKQFFDAKKSLSYNFCGIENSAKQDVIDFAPTLLTIEQFAYQYDQKKLEQLRELMALFLKEGFLSNSQADSVMQSLYAAKQGTGFILADGCGIGKTRIMIASAIMMGILELNDPNKDVFHELFIMQNQDAFKRTFESDFKLVLNILKTDKKIESFEFQKNKANHPRIVVNFQKEAIKKSIQIEFLTAETIKIRKTDLREMDIDAIWVDEVHKLDKKKGKDAASEESGLGSNLQTLIDSKESFPRTFASATFLSDIKRMGYLFPYVLKKEYYESIKALFNSTEINEESCATLFGILQKNQVLSAKHIDSLIEQSKKVETQVLLGEGSQQISTDLSSKNEVLDTIRELLKEMKGQLHNLSCKKVNIDAQIHQLIYRCEQDLMLIHLLEQKHRDNRNQLLVVNEYKESERPEYFEEEAAKLPEGPEKSKLLQKIFEIKNAFKRLSITPDMGIPLDIARYCTEMSKQKGIKIEFNTSFDPNDKNKIVVISNKNLTGYDYNQTLTEFAEDPVPLYMTVLGSKTKPEEFTQMMGRVIRTNNVRMPKIVQFKFFEIDHRLLRLETKLGLMRSLTQGAQQDSWLKYQDVLKVIVEDEGKMHRLISFFPELSNMAKEHFLKESKLHNKTNSIDQSSAEDFFKYLKFVPSNTVQKVYNFLIDTAKKMEAELPQKEALDPKKSQIIYEGRVNAKDVRLYKQDICNGGAVVYAIGDEMLPFVSLLTAVFNKKAEHYPTVSKDFSFAYCVSGEEYKQFASIFTSQMIEAVFSNPDVLVSFQNESTDVVRPTQSPLSQLLPPRRDKRRDDNPAAVPSRKQKKDPFYIDPFSNSAVVPSGGSKRNIDSVESGSESEAEENAHPRAKRNKIAGNVAASSAPLEMEVEPAQQVQVLSMVDYYNSDFYILLMQLEEADTSEKQAAFQEEFTNKLKKEGYAYFLKKFPYPEGKDKEGKDQYSWISFYDFCMRINDDVQKPTLKYIQECEEAYKEGMSILGIKSGTSQKMATNMEVDERFTIKLKGQPIYQLHRFKDLPIRAQKKADSLSRNWTALHAAVFHQNKAALAYFLDKTTILTDEKTRDRLPQEDESTALHMAVAQLVEIINKSSDNLNEESIPKIETAKEIVKMLLSKGAKIDVQDHERKVPGNLFEVEDIKLQAINSKVPGLEDLKERLRVSASQEEVASAVESSGDASASSDRAKSPLFGAIQLRIQLIKEKLLLDSAELSVKSFDRQSIFSKYQQKSMFVQEDVFKNDIESYCKAIAQLPLSDTAYKDELSQELSKIIQNYAENCFESSKRLVFLRCFFEDRPQLFDKLPQHCKAYLEEKKQDLQHLNLKFGDAINNHEIDKIIELIQRGADINAQDRNGFAALLVAAEKGHTEVVSLLLENGANKEVKDSAGRTALMVAAGNGHVDAVSLLLKYCADINAQDRNGFTALLVAAEKGHTGVVSLLLEYCADINAQDRRGYTALLVAAANGDIEVVRLLLEKGANKEAQSVSGSTALMIAVVREQVGAVRLLLENGADINAQNSSGYTPLIYAASRGRLNIVECLVENEADIYAQNRSGYTALMAAESNRHMEVVSFLKEKLREKKGPKSPTLGIVCNDKFIEAASESNIDKIIELIQSGADINAQDRNGFTALWVAAAKGHTEVVRFLLKNGANKDAQSVSGYTALMIAAENGDQTLAKFLLENGANKDAQSVSGYTALMIAVAKGHTEVVRFLLKNGANKEVKDSTGRTALSYGLEKGSEEVVSLLIGNSETDEAVIEDILALMQAEGI